MTAEEREGRRKASDMQWREPICVAVVVAPFPPAAAGGVESRSVGALVASDVDE